MNEEAQTIDESIDNPSVSGIEYGENMDEDSEGMTMNTQPTQGTMENTEELIDGAFDTLEDDKSEVELLLTGERDDEEESADDEEVTAMVDGHPDTAQQYEVKVNYLKQSQLFNSSFCRLFVGHYRRGSYIAMRAEAVSKRPTRPSASRRCPKH